MKKLWYLLPALFLALGIVACGEDDTQTDSPPPFCGQRQAGRWPRAEVLSQCVWDWVTLAFWLTLTSGANAPIPKERKADRP